MKYSKYRAFIVGAALVLATGMTAQAEVKIVTNHNEAGDSKPEFKFKEVASPAKESAATKAKFSIVDGDADSASGELTKLNDGKLPTEEDQPDENFFFSAGSEGGRLEADLGSVMSVKQVATYSWHPSTRAPQVYKLYGSEGTAKDFSAQPKTGTNPEKVGWKLIATVDTRPKSGDGGGQYGVNVSNTDGALGKYRYLLFDISRTESDDDFGNTFFSEINIFEQK
jgi:hypothetical protein